MPAQRTRDTQRSLEVSTQMSSLPTLSVISPTPRAFTFASAHNLCDSPYSSPSHSPFEPDLTSFSLLPSSTPPPNISRTITPIASHTSTSSSPKRRKSVSICDLEHRPKKGDENYIKRPENAFILFRRQCCEERQAAEAIADAPTKKQRQADLSKSISQRWKALSKEEKERWESMAKEKKKEHAQMYPDYVYRPQRAKDKDGRPKPRKPRSPNKRDQERDAELADHLTFAIPIQPPRQHGRSASAPTPPITHQIIRVPNLHMTPLSPSCPTSPSLLPMINRRASHSDVPMNHFDYVPNSLMPVSFGQAGQYEAGIQQSQQFYPGMFAPSYPNIPGVPGLSRHTTLLPAQDVISPSSSIASGSSAPPSPQTGPYTPSDPQRPFLQPFELMYPQNGNDYCSSEPQSQEDIELNFQAMAQYHAQSWYDNSVWRNSEDAILEQSDFDLDCIPIAQLEEVKGGEHLDLSLVPIEENESLSQYLHDPQPLDSLLHYDEMMAELS